MTQHRIQRDKLCVPRIPDDRVRIRVNVVPKAKKSGIEQLPDGHWRIRVVAPAEGGRANAAVIALVAEHFGVPKQSVRIVHGVTHRQKVLDIAAQ